MEYLLIKDNIVENIISADENFIATISQEWDEILPRNGEGIGWTYNGSTFEAPVITVPVEPPKYLSKLGFRNRFTPEEKALIEFAALDNPAATMSDRMLSATIRATLADQRDATYIDPTRPDTRQGVIGMETGGLLTAGRALEILDAPIEDDEMFKG